MEVFFFQGIKKAVEECLNPESDYYATPVERDPACTSFKKGAFGMCVSQYLTINCPKPITHDEECKEYIEMYKCHFNIWVEHKKKNISLIYTTVVPHVG